MNTTCPVASRGSHGTRGPRVDAQVAHAWLLHQPVVPTVIAGARTLEQLKTTIQAEDVSLDEDTLAEFDRIWPGPGEISQLHAW